MGYIQGWYKGFWCRRSLDTIWIRLRASDLLADMMLEISSFPMGPRGEDKADIVEPFVNPLHGVAGVVVHSQMKASEEVLRGIGTAKCIMFRGVVYAWLICVVI